MKWAGSAVNTTFIQPAILHEVAINLSSAKQVPRLNKHNFVLIWHQKFTNKSMKSSLTSLSHRGKVNALLFFKTPVLLGDTCSYWWDQRVSSWWSAVGERLRRSWAPVGRFLTDCADWCADWRWKKSLWLAVEPSKSVREKRKSVAVR